MTFSPKRVAVIGGGIMGGGIAAFFANRKIAVDIFDVTKELSEATLEKISDLDAKPPVLYSKSAAKKITPYATADLAKAPAQQALAQADMIVEAVPEVLAIKRQVFEQVDQFRKPGSVVCSNTSGLSLAAMAEGRSADFRAHFLGTHYFNPVRFVHLVELIPGTDTRPELVEDLYAWFRQAGKRPVVGRDTPNFIANRVGVFAFLKAMKLMEKYGLTVEQVDMITGPSLGNPKTATFRLADMVGIDTLVHVARNAFENCPKDEEREVFRIPAWLDRMVAEKRLGNKTNGGFYKKGAKKGDPILALDVVSGQYRPQQKPKSDAVKQAKGHVHVLDRIRAMLTYPGAGASEDPISSFARELTYSTAAYALNRVGEIAEDPAAIDEALRYGFNREIGPIESLDAVGLEAAAEGMRRYGIKVPAILQKAIAGPGRFAEQKGGERSVFDIRTGQMRRVPDAPGTLNLERIKQSGGIVRENLSGRLVDLGDGVLLLEPDSAFVPGINPVDDQLISLMQQALEIMPTGWRALVVGNESANFSAGAQLQLVLDYSRAKRFKEIEEMSRAFQSANLAFKRAPYPVVCAPHGLALGGGMELTLAGSHRVACAELYCGLVETGVGLLPAGGGCLFLLEQWMDTMQVANPGPMPPVAQAFELIAYAKVSTSAEHARELGLLNYEVVIEPSKDRLLARAKEVALQRAAGFTPRGPRTLDLPGKSGFLVLKYTIADLVTAGKITPHAAKIATHQARILSGGETADYVEPVTEERILELEREGFMSLCGEPLSQARMEHMLKTGKPLFN